MPSRIFEGIIPDLQSRKIDRQNGTNDIKLDVFK